MPVNGPPFPVKVWLYPGANPSANATSWPVETDISAYVRYPGSDGGQAIEYTAGRGDEASQVDPSTMNLTLDNRDGRFSTRNVAGPYFGLLRKGTPIRMGVVSGLDTFTRTSSSGWGSADSGHVWAISGTAADWTTDGTRGLLTFPTANQARIAVATGATSLDVDVTMVAAPAAVSTGASIVAGPIVRRTDNANQISARLDFTTGGTTLIRLVRTVNNVSADLATTSLPTVYTAGQRWKVRCQADGSTIRMKAWPEATAEPAWQISGTDNLLTGAAVGIYFARISGNTNAAPQIAVDDYVVTCFEFTGSVVQWPLRWDKSSKNSWAPIQAGGSLRRLIQGKGTLKSPLARQLPSYKPTGYWPLEDGAGATVFGSAAGTNAAATFVGVDPATDTSLAGGGPAPSLSATNGRISGAIVKKLITGGTGFSFMFFTKFDSGLPVTDTVMASISTTVLATRYDMSISSTGVTIKAIDINGTAIATVTNAFGSIDTSQWVAWQLETENVAGVINFAFIWHQVGKTVYLAQSGTLPGGLTGATPTMSKWTLGGTNLPVGTSFAHVWCGPNTLPFVDDNFSLVSSGYAGELAAARVARLCAEQGIPVTIEPGDSAPVGIQPQNNIISALRSAESADMGILYERGVGLGYRPRFARYNQPVAMALTVAAGQVDDPPEPIDDDQRLRNQITVSRDGGSYAVALDQASIDADGLYEDSITINAFQDDVLPNHAGWRLYLGTRPDLRWPGLSLDFARNPDLLQAWRARGFGPRMTVATGLTQLVGADPDVVVEGYSGTLWPHGWKVKLNCSSAMTWDVATLDSVTAPPRADTAGSVLQVGVSTTATSWTVDTTVGPAWNPATTFPFLIQCEGEVVQVNSITGAGPTGQVFSVTRSVNGIVKAHLALAPLSLAQPGRAAL